MVLSKRYSGRLLSRLLSDFVLRNRAWMMLGNIDLSDVVMYYLEQRLKVISPTGDYVPDGIECDNIIIHTLELFAPLQSDSNAIKMCTHSWRDVLMDYKGCVIVFARDSSTIVGCQKNLIGLIDDVLIVTCDDFPESISLPENFYHLKMVNTDIIKYCNTYFIRCFPSIFETVNSMDWILSIISPPEIILLETDSIESKVMRSVAAGLSINVKFMQ